MGVRYLLERFFFYSTDNSDSDTRASTYTHAHTRTHTFTHMHTHTHLMSLCYSVLDQIMFLDSTEF